MADSGCTRNWLLCVSHAGGGSPDVDIKRGYGVWEKWYVLEKPTPKVIDYVRRMIPVDYRTFDGATQHWYVHEKYVEAIHKLLSHGAVSVTPDDPWALLYLRPGAPQAIIKAVWREMAKELHPDRGGDEEKFKKVKAAYEKLVKV
jgi:hypothetical protein